MREPFAVQGDVHRNVAELRKYLGSVQRPLSLGGLARALNERDGRQRSASSIQRWEDGAEPDYASAKLMAELAGVTFEEFALGAPAAKAPPRQETTAHYERAGRAAAKKTGRKAG